MNFWLSYRRVLAVTAVAVFFTATCDYLFAAGFISAPPLYWILAFTALAQPLVFTSQTVSGVLKSPVTPWCGFYAALTVLAFMWSSQSAIAWGQLRVRILAVLFIGSLLFVFSDSRVHRAVRIALFCSALLGVVLNVVDLARPLSFSPILGRAAGLYLNPNTSAIALVLGMIMSVELLPHAFRPWFVSLVGAGVLLTFSRGGAAAWLVATSLLIWLRTVRLVPLLRVVVTSALVVGGVLLISGWWQAAWQMASVASSEPLGRLRLETEIVDASADVRLGAARLSWQMFLDSPVHGWGPGATLEWDWSDATHNIYLRDLAEYGFAGLAIVPLLVLALLRRGAATRAPAAVWLASVTLLWGVFSHNLLDERHFLICFALVGTLSGGGREGEAVAPVQPAIAFPLVPRAYL